MAVDTNYANVSLTAEKSKFFPPQPFPHTKSTAALWGELPNLY